MYLLRGSHSGRNAGMPGMQRRTREKITRIHPAHTSERRGGRKKMPFVLSLFTAIFKFIVISLAWMALEKKFYGEVQPRIVDDIIGLVLFFYILKGEIL